VTSADLSGSSVPAPPPTKRQTALREGLRRVVHAASGLLAPVALALPGHGGDVLFGALVLLALGVETSRRFVPLVQRLVVAAGGALLRPGEFRGVTGPTMLACGYAVVWWLFAAPVAVAAVWVTALADPAAALVGRAFGGGVGKSWVGSASCVTVAGVVLVVVGVPMPTALVTAVVAATAERIAWSGADNVLLPVSVGVTLTLLGFQ
jgi:dolichol kinase